MPPNVLYSPYLYSCMQCDYILPFFLLQTLLAYSTIGTISLFVVFSVLASVAALLLPIETRGRAMKVNNHYQTVYPAVCYYSLTNRILVDDITKKYIHELNLIFNIKFNIDFL